MPRRRTKDALRTSIGRRLGTVSQNEGSNDLNHGAYGATNMKMR